MPLEDDLIEQRIERTRQIEALGFRPYGQRFDYSHTIAGVLAAFTPRTAEELDAERIGVRGRGDRGRPRTATPS